MNNKKYNWWMISALTLIPMVGIFGSILHSYYFGVVWQEIFILIIGWWLSGIGITFGYHRLFAHRSFQAHKLVQFIAIILGSSALQNSVLKWSSDHRIHHKKLDSKDDPYSIKKGFWYAHIGWIVQKKDPIIKGVNDLKNNRLVMWQHEYYYLISIFVSFIIPALIGLSYNRPIGGLLWGGFLRITLIHHTTFFINSLCHYVGNKPYDSNISARDCWWVAYLTFGEGYHNYHHKFQWDYRNGVNWYSFDPGKWIIQTLSWFGLTKKIKKVSEYQIFSAKMQSLKDSIQSQISEMPEIMRNQYLAKINELQETGNKIISSWKELEREIIGMNKKEISDKFQLAVQKQKRKLYRKEFLGVINGFTVLFVNLKS